jgi:predicted DNA-binding transcriptional regulator YafY
VYFPTTRVLTVLELLQSRVRISGPELASRLEVDTRTVRRYITMLQDLGIPVEAERGRYGSYRLRPGFKLPPMMFTDEEALALSLGLLAARSIGLSGAAPAVEGALAKIERVLPETLRKRFQALQETLIFDMAALGPPPRSEIVGVLSTAAQQKRRILLRYHAYDETVTEREFDPYGLVYRSGYWYVAGYCHLRQDLRTFRLDRMLHAALLDQTFTPPPDFDALEHVVRSLPNTPAQWEVDVLLKMTLEEARQRVPPALAVLEQREEGVSFHCFVNSLDWMAYMLVGLQCPLVIHKPVELHDAIKRLAEYITANLVEQ